MPHGQGLLELLGADVAEADRADQPFVAEGNQFGELVIQRYDVVAGSDEARALVRSAEVDHGYLLQAERREVEVDLLPQLLRSLCEGQRDRCVHPACTDLAHDHEVVRVWVQGGADVRVDRGVPVERSGVEVVDSELDGAVEDRARCGGVDVFELHRAVPDPRDLVLPELDCAARSFGCHQAVSPGRVPEVEVSPFPSTVALTGGFSTYAGGR